MRVGVLLFAFGLLAFLSVGGNHGEAMAGSQDDAERPWWDRRGKVTTEHDKFTGETTIALTMMDLGGQVYLSAFAKPNADHITLSFWVRGRTWGFVKCHPVDWLIDEAPAPGPPTVHDGEVTENGVEETIRQVLPVAFFRRFNTAKTLKGRLCSYEFDFTDDQRQTLREFSEAVGID